MLISVTERYMAGYTPVFRAILQSTVWDEAPHVKVVWLTMLLMCDKNGFVESTIPGLARSSVVTREQCIEAIERLSSPDPDSKTKAQEGRRIVKVDDGWQLVNHQKYKDKVGLSSKAARERVRTHRSRKKDSRKKSNTENAQKPTLENVTNSDTLDTCNACNGIPIGIGIGIGIGFPSQIPSLNSENSQLAESDQAIGSVESEQAADCGTVAKKTKRDDPMRRSFEPPKEVEVLMFEAWRDAAEQPGASLDSKRKELFGILHDDGVTVEQVRQATLGAKHDPWAIGAHLKPSAILKNADQRERFIALYHNPELAKLTQRQNGKTQNEKWGEGRGNGPQPNDPNNRIVPNTIEFSPEELASAQDS